MKKGNDNNTRSARLEIRISKDLKEKFEKVCEENAYNKSEVIRKFIQKFIFENS